MTFLEILSFPFRQLSAAKPQINIVDPSPYPKRGEERVIKRLVQYRLFKAQMEMDEWRMAIVAAEDPQLYDRRRLLAIYRETVRDPHTLSQILTVQNKIISEPFIIINKETGVPDDDRQELLERPWFDQYLKYCNEAEFWGFSLVEFQPLCPSHSKLLPLEFDSIKLVPRDYVRPERGIVVLNQNEMYKGLAFNTPPFNTWLIPIGDPYNIGLLHVLAREVIWKNQSRTDWSIHSEKFGMPYMVIKTASNQKDELDAKAQMAANFGSNAWAILDEGDDIQLLETAKNDAYQIYLQLITLCDQQTAKAVNGQTGTSDEQAFVGSAQVHERILNDFIKARLKGIMNHINFELFPFLSGKGYPLDGYEFQYPVLYQDSNTNATTPDGDEPAPTDPKLTGLSGSAARLKKKP